MRSNLTIDYFLPTRIVLKSDNIFDSNYLLNNENTQVYIGQQDYITIKGKGFIVLDFGEELQGGVRILTHRFPTTYGGNIHIRFGESVDETCADLGEKNATNHHSLRDFTIFMPHLADQMFGQTGFRFVRFDFLDDIEYRLINIYATYLHRDIQTLTTFKTNDEKINKIFNTAIHTLELNLQENLLEGVKRDRLVWIGDMQPEVLAYSYLYTDYAIVKKAIEDSLNFNPLPCWFGRIPTYSFWLIDILNIYLDNTDDKEFVISNFSYIEGVINQLNLCVDYNGEIDYAKCEADVREGFFFDWPTNGTVDAKEGNRYIFIYTLNHYLDLCKKVGKTPVKIVDDLLNRLKNKNKIDLNKKQVIALGYLCQMLDKEETKNKLFLNGAKGLSTFFSYFIFKAMSLVGEMSDTLNLLKEFYGAMIDRGATSFWEDFDIDWLKNSGRIDEITPSNQLSLHGDFGAYCYKGFRHSLSHGWSVGPISFLIEDVLGYKLNGHVVTFKPNLGFLDYIDASINTHFGLIKVHVDKTSLKVETPPSLIYQENHD